MEFPEIPADLSALSDVELAELESQLVAAFNEATAEGAAHTDDDVAQLSSVADGIDTIRAESATRAQAASARQDQLASLADRVNASTGEDGDDAAGDEEPDTDEGNTDQPQGNPATPDRSDDGGDEGDQGGEGQPAAAPAKSVTASVAQLKRHAPAKTRPRPSDPAKAFPTITASADIAGVTAGSKITDLRKAGEMLSERRRTLGEGNGDRASVIQLHRQLPSDRDLRGIESPEAFSDFLSKFDTSAQGIQAAGGLCAPTEGYYDQYVLAQAMRPVRDALPSFNADRGGLRFNPPPKLSDITTGSGTGIHKITMAEDAAGSPTKGTFSLACPSIEEVIIYAIYMQLKFSNVPARTFPERYEAITKTAVAKAASLAETYLLDAIAAKSTSVTAAGLVGAGRELFARLGQAAAGYRSRHRLDPNFPLRVLLPAWSLDLVQADFARTFTDDQGFIQMSREDAARLFGARNLNPSFYVDSKTGGGQVFGAVDSGRTVTDGATNTNTTVTSATGAFSSADVNRPITGTGIPAGTTITAVASATSITISQAATATATGVTIRIGGNVLRQFPTTVYTYLFAEGSFLHLDGGTLDLGLVRDSTLNATNEFTTFTEEFENVAFVGQESDEIAFSLNPDGSYAAARSISVPINT